MKINIHLLGFSSFREKFCTELDNNFSLFHCSKFTNSYCKCQFFPNNIYLMTLLHLLHIGVRVPAGMCSARCTRELRSSGCGCGVGRSGPLGAGLVTLPNEGTAPPLGKPKPTGKIMGQYSNRGKKLAQHLVH